MDNYSGLNIISTTPFELGNIVGKNLVAQIVDDFDFKAAFFQSISVGDTYESLPIVVNEPGTYSFYIMRTTFVGAGKATFSVATKASLDGSTFNTSYGLIDLFSGPNYAQVLPLRSFVVTSPSTVVMRFVVTTNKIQLGNIILVKE